MPGGGGTVGASIGAIGLSGNGSERKTDENLIILKP